MNKDNELAKKRDRAFCYKSNSISIKEINNESRVVKGYLASFNTKDEASDILLPGCFAKSIQEHGPESSSPQKIIHCWQHDHTSPLGKYLVLREDDKGLYFEAEFDPIPKANEVLAQYASGTLNQHSIGFWYVWDKVRYDEERDAFLVGELKLIEGSTVTFGCNENTPFMGFGKNITNEQTFDLLSVEVSTALKGLDYNKQIEMRKIISKYQSLVNFEPIKESLKGNKPSEKITSLNELFKINK